MKSVLLPGLAACIAAVVTVVAQTNPMRPGQWEVTIQMQMPNMPVQMPEMKSSQCITADQLEQDPATGLPRGAQDQGQNACKVSDYKQSGNTVTWKMTCTGEAAMTADGEMTFAGDSYTGTMKMATPQGNMSMKLAGKRIGDCRQ
jgi:hypothetical protein